jgi:hypothetical protein
MGGIRNRENIEGLAEFLRHVAGLDFAVRYQMSDMPSGQQSEFFLIVISAFATPSN